MALPISVNAKGFFETAQRLHDYSIEHEKFKSGNEYNLSDMIYFTGYVMGVSDVLNG